MIEYNVALCSSIFQVQNFDDQLYLQLLISDPANSRREIVRAAYITYYGAGENEAMEKQILFSICKTRKLHEQPGRPNKETGEIKVAMG